MLAGSLSKAKATRAFPTQLAPVEGEAFASYLERLASHHDVSVGSVLRASGLTLPNYEKLNSWYGVYLSEAQLQSFSSATRLSPEVISPMLLSFYTGKVLASSSMAEFQRNPGARLSTNEWVYRSGSHVCPACLQEDNGAWQLSWKLPWSFVCLRHEQLLIDTCPQCVRRTGKVAPHNAALIPCKSVIPRPGYCLNQTSHRGLITTCGYALNTHRALSSKSWTTVLSSQYQLNAAMRGEPIALPDETVSSLEYIQEVRSLSMFLLYAADRQCFGELPSALEEAIETYIEQRQKSLDERRRLRGSRGGLGHPSLLASQSAAIMAAVLPVATRMVQAKSFSELTNELIKPVKAVFERRAIHTEGFRVSLLRYKFSPRLSEAANACLENLRASSYGFGRRVRGDSQVEKTPRAKRTDGFSDRHQPQLLWHNENRQKQFSFGAEHLPHLIWEQEYEQRFAVFSTAKGVRGRCNSRKACSIALAALSSKSTWEQAGQALGMNGAAKLVCSFISPLDRAARISFSDQLYELAVAYEQSSDKTDYGARRVSLMAFRHIPETHLKNLYAQAAVAFYPSKHRSSFVTAWIWSSLTGSDWHTAPCLQNIDLSWWRKRFRIWLEEILPRLKRVLTAYSADMLDIYMSDDTENQNLLRNGRVKALIACRYCDGYDLSRHGSTGVSQPVYECHSCKRLFVVSPVRKSYSEAFRAQVIDAYFAGLGPQALANAFGISSPTASNWIGKALRQKDAATGQPMKPARQRNAYPLYFRRQIVEAVEREGLSVSEAASRFDVSPPTVRSYLKLSASGSLAPTPWSRGGKPYRLDAAAQQKLDEQLHSFPDLTASQHSRLLFGKHRIIYSPREIRRYLHRRRAAQTVLPN